MGWFNNTLTMNRASNSLALVSAAAVLEESRTTLSAANQFVSQQKQRGNNLSAQAFSVQGASSTIGRSLQQAINDLGDFERDSREVGEDLDDRLQTLGLVVEQFSMPRAQRALNMSGREMASGMLENSGEVVANMNTLKNRHWNKVAGAVTIIDNADQQLNGSAGIRARGSLPSLD